MKKIKWQVIVAAIAGITILESIALLKGINGTILTIVVGAIAGLAGLAAKTPECLQG